MDLQSLLKTNKTRASHNLYIQDSIQECLETYQSSLDTLQYCIQKRDPDYSDPQLLKLLQSTAEITLASARLMLLQSPFQSHLCAISAAVCQECSKYCDQFEDKILQDCAEACRDCSEACLRLTE